MKIFLGLTAKGYQQNKEYLADFEKLISIFSSNEITWYLSPPYSKKYNSRSLDLDEYEILKKQVSLLKKYGYQLQLALNTNNLSSLDISLGIDKFIRDFGRPASIVTLNEYVPQLLHLNIPLVYSFNNIIFGDNLKFCSSVVVGRKEIRNIDLIQSLKDKGLEVELLVNNGCHFYCNRKCGKTNDCGFLQIKRIEQVGKLQCLAEQSLLPEELSLYPKDFISSIKISTRPATLNYLYKVVNDYSSKQTSLSLKDLELAENWYYYSRLSHIINFLSNEKIPVLEVLEKKEKIWLDIYNENFIEQSRVREVFGSLKYKLLGRSETCL